MTTDHAVAIGAIKQHIIEILEHEETLRAMTDALQAFMSLPHLFDDVCVSEKPDCKVCAAIEKARAALVTPAPEQPSAESKQIRRLRDQIEWLRNTIEWLKAFIPDATDYATGQMLVARLEAELTRLLGNQNEGENNGRN